MTTQQPHWSSLSPPAIAEIDGQISNLPQNIAASENGLWKLIFCEDWHLQQSLCWYVASLWSTT